jgi:hypothetical protein
VTEFPARIPIPANDDDFPFPAILIRDSITGTNDGFGADVRIAGYFTIRFGAENGDFVVPADTNFGGNPVRIPRVPIRADAAFQCAFLQEEPLNPHVRGPYR